MAFVHDYMTVQFSIFDSIKTIKANGFNREVLPFPPYGF